MDAAVRTGVSWQLDLLLLSSMIGHASLSSVDCMRGYALEIIIVKRLRFVVITDSSLSWSAVDVPTTIFTVQRTLSSIECAEVVALVVDGGRRVTYEVVAHIGESALHVVDVGEVTSHSSFRAADLLAVA